ncbi:MAG: RNA degradosome polyphosphate kinase, partial [Chloroflexi bacterium]|nr:RNA degradosome polyphosphate kinase [Chloroflexota bacterium]
NSKTARLYVDLGILSCREELGADVTDLFNTLTGLSRQRVFRRLLVAPITLRSRFLELVERETANARAGHPARIVLKVNSLVDTQVIESLYEAAKAGVYIDLIVRGACCMLPGLPGVSERVRVRSIIGEFLEHSRIWMFANAGRAEWYIGSADLMERNLDRRVEVVTPVEDNEARARLARIIEVMMADDRRSWQLGSDGRWQRTEVIGSLEGTLDTFAMLKEDAAATATATDASHGLMSGAGSMDPRA